MNENQYLLSIVLIILSFVAKVTKEENVINYAHKILEQECPICLQVMLIDPHLVSYCGHQFCDPCIKKINGPVIF